MHEQPGLDRVVRMADEVIFRELQGEAVILNLASSTYFGLDPVGTRIWQLCVAHGSLRSVWEAMQQEFDASSEMLRTDLLTFVDELLAKGLFSVESHAG